MPCVKVRQQGQRGRVSYAVCEGEAAGTEGQGKLCRSMLCYTLCIISCAPVLSKGTHQDLPIGLRQLLVLACGHVLPMHACINCWTRLLLNLQHTAESANTTILIGRLCRVLQFQQQQGQQDTNWPVCAVAACLAVDLLCKSPQAS
jgi:hypothetical protein